MDKEKLKQHLLSERTKLFCVLDGASVPDLPVRLYEMRPPNYCLFSGELATDMAYVAPYVINLLPNHKFTDWVLNESFGNHWGIFAHSLYSIKEMRRHFRSLVSVYDEHGNPLTFRFYDPRVLRRFLPTCNAGELKTFFGKIERYFAEEDENLLGFELETDKLKKSTFDLN
ncbi:MAG TPA: DUF4123 domain-containing protein [Pyrinomonadaceae bacterium]|jgi:hypothetical protein